MSKIRKDETVEGISLAYLSHSKRSGSLLLVVPQEARERSGAKPGMRFVVRVAGTRIIFDPLNTTTEEPRDR